MLVIKRNKKEWVEITHSSGQTIRIQVQRITHNRKGGPTSVYLAFDDDARNFRIDRPDRIPAPTPAPEANGNR